MEWLFDPGIWVGLFTLIVLEIVLGIDNLVFIAILADKLPPKQRDRARLIGLSLALVMRLGLLSIVSWLVTLTEPLFSVGQFSFSGRALILLLGGVFLLVKATMELHERLEGAEGSHAKSKAYAGFWIVIAQIVALDAVFSLDSVITAVGMVDELGVMMAAVIVAMAVMMLASKPLTGFVNAHPTVVVLCLSFLLMIGFSLVAEGFGFHIPKGYLYAAIGFSIAIEFFNQLARRNQIKHQARLPLRDRTADAVLRLLGGRRGANTEGTEEAAVAADAPPFAPEERTMVSGVLTLGERSIRSIMTPRADMSWINIESDEATIRERLLDTPHSYFPVCRGELDNLIGVARAKDLVDALSSGRPLDTAVDLRTPVMIHESAGVLKAMDLLKRSHGQLILVTDEYGAIQGIVTPVDILEAIAGEFPDEDEQPAVQQTKPGEWQVDGATNLHYLEQVLETHGFVADGAGYTSLAGFLLKRFATRPKPGEAIDAQGFRFEVIAITDRRIAKVKISRIETAPAVDP